MIDRFGREITYLRVSVTDRCNLNCSYCKPPAQTSFAPRREVISFEETAEVVRVAVDLGIRKVRLTGGEPLVRRGVHTLVRMIASIDGIKDLAMSTNGILLAEHARALADAGLHRVNVSLDSINPERYRGITGGGDLSRVLAGIEAAGDAGLKPVKLNCVFRQSSDEPDARGVARFAGENGLDVRFVRQMDFQAGTFSVVEGGAGGDCSQCNRLRLSCDGQVRPCLFSDLSFSVRELGVIGALEQAILSKPETGAPCSRSWIRITGG